MLALSKVFLRTRFAEKQHFTGHMLLYGFSFLRRLVLRI